MSDPLTNNLSLILMSTGTASGTWGTILNSNMITYTDAALGNTVSVAVSSSTVNLTTTQRQNLAFNLTGTLSNSINVTLPLNPNSTTAAVGGFFVFDNNSTGSFGITVKTVATGSVGVDVPQGARALLYSDGTNIKYADDAQNQLIAYNGDPNGNVAGNAASASTRASKVINRATNETFLATTSGTAGNAVWYRDLPYSFASQGYLTASSDATNPVLTADSLGATTIYYTAFRGNYVWLYNGTSLYPAPIPSGQLSLALSATYQVANGIYDVMGFLNGTTLAVGFSPIWSTVTAGSGARGTGAGTPQLSRVNGVLVNAVLQTVNNGASLYTVGTSKGTYLGSVWIDSTAGQVTCHRTYGQARKFGIWNAYNREPIYLKEGDPSTGWTYGTNTFRPMNNSTSNAVYAFNGLPEETVQVVLSAVTSSTSGGLNLITGIGWNSTTVASGFNGFGLTPSSFSSVKAAYAPSVYFVSPFIGIGTATALEKASGVATFYGTEADMLLTAVWNG